MFARVACPARSGASVQVTRGCLAGRGLRDSADLRDRRAMWALMGPRAPRVRRETRATLAGGVSAACAAIWGCQASRGHPALT